MREPRGLVVVGASAGGVEALRTFVSGLPVTLDAAVCVVLHISPAGTSALPHILSRSGPLPAVYATDGCLLAAGTIYVAPANAHVMVIGGRLRLSRGPTENGHRPAADPLFRSAAREWGSGVVGVVLSGGQDDGAYGLATIARHGGAGLIQEFDEALYPSMPQHAATLVPAARVMQVAEMAAVLVELVGRMSGPDPVDAQNAPAATAGVGAQDADAVPPGYGCPSCHGALSQLPGTRRSPRFRCPVGHVWSQAALIEEQGAAVEGALWMALRSLEEKAALSGRMADSAAARGNDSTAARFHEARTETEIAGRAIRRLIDQLGPIEDPTP